MTAQLDRLGDAARGHDPLGLGDHSNLAAAQRARWPNALASAPTPRLVDRPRAPPAPTSARRLTAAGSSRRCTTSCRRAAQAPAGRDRAGRPAAGSDRPRYGGVLALREGDRERRHDDDCRSALARINEILDQVLNEQEGDFDATTRFAIAWYRQHGYGDGKFGDADDLARARNTAVETMVRDGILTSAAGKVTLLSPLELPEGYDVRR